LEAVEVGQDEAEPAAEPLDAGELGRENGLAVATVDEPGQAVDSRLVLHDAVQARVLERDQCLSCQRLGGLLFFAREPGAGEREDAEALSWRLEGKLDRGAASGGLADATLVSSAADEASSPGSGRLDGRLDDHPPKLVGVVSRRECSA